MNRRELLKLGCLLPFASINNLLAHTPDIIDELLDELFIKIKSNPTGTKVKFYGAWVDPYLHRQYNYGLYSTVEFEETKETKIAVDKFMNEISTVGYNNIGEYIMDIPHHPGERVAIAEQWNIHEFQAKTKYKNIEELVFDINNRLEKRLILEGLNA